MFSSKERHPATKRRVLLTASAAAAVLLAGCTVGPDYHAPHSSVPNDWSGPTTAPTSQPSVAVTQAADLARWWTTFHDPVLDSLVQRAIESNLSLRQAEARIRQARAARGVVAGGLWPSINANANYRRVFSGTGGFATGTTPGGTGTTGTGTTLARGGGGGGGSEDFYQAGFDAAWELDVFGGTRRNVEAAGADIQAAVEDRRDVLVTLIGEVALNYVNLRGLQQELVIARNNLQAQQQTAALTRKRVLGGLNSRLDVANADAQVATTEAAIPVFETSAQQAIYNISVLLGQAPGALLQELTVQTPIPTVPPEVPVGLPSDLLRRRPDIRRAEAQIHAATARIGVATADLFPKFSLTGVFGTQGTTFSSLGNWDSRFWSIGPSVSWNLFNGGAVRSPIEVQKALEEQTFLTYQQAVLTALQDVENALIAYSKEQQHNKSLADAVAANREAVDLSTRLYTAGQTDFLNVLTAQRALFAAEDALVRSQSAVATDLVSLYKALGGGWQVEGSAPPTTAPTTQPAVAVTPVARPAGG